LLCAITCACLSIACKKTGSPSNNTNPQTVQPEPTAIGTPNGNPVTKTIGPAGGSVISDDGTAELIIPANALSANTTIGIQPITNNCPGGALLAYRFTPDKLHFDQSITVKFHYTDDYLKSTLADLMGIAYQDSTGAWYSFGDISNDSINKVISVSTNHFTDYTQFSILAIVPQSAHLRTNQTLDLHVEAAFTDDDELVPLPVAGVTPDPVVSPIVVYKTDKCNWTINGGLTNGNYGSFVSDQGRLTITYQAPGTVPSHGNPVAIAATIDLGGMTFHKKKFNKTILVSNVKIGNLSFDVDVDVTILKTSEVYNDHYNDGASFEVDVDEHDIVSIPISVNRAPTVTPASGSSGNTTATWVADGIGLTNIVGGFGAFGNDSVSVLITHSGTITPKWNVMDPVLGDYSFGNEATPGVPGALVFAAADSVQHLTEDNGTGGKIIITYTITPKP